MKKRFLSRRQFSAHCAALGVSLPISNAMMPGLYGVSAYGTELGW